jgi:hypothetical protein
MKIQYILLLIFLISFSCRTPKKEHPKSGQIDSLFTEIDSINHQLKQLDIEFVLEVYDSIETQMEHAENIHTVKKLRKKEDHLRTILEWYDNVYREIIYARNHLETIREDMQEGVEDDSVITNQLNSEDSILEDLNNRCLNQINKLSNRIEDIKRQYRKDE